MSKTAAKKKSLILVSHDYDPKAWDTLESGETEFESWVSVAQDIWGKGCYGPGQEHAIRQGANGVTITKAKIVGVIGAALGGVGVVAEENTAYMDVLDCDAEVLDYKRQNPGTSPGSKFLKLFPWDPQKPEVKPARYHGLVASGAVANAENLTDIVQVLAEAIKPGGYLFIDEIYVDDPSAAALIAQGIARPGQRLHLRSQDTVAKSFQGAFLDLRSNVSSADLLMEAIREGLKRGKEIAQLLTTIPKPFRKQRMTAFAIELQRAAVLFQALERGLATAGRSIFRQAGDL